MPIDGWRIHRRIGMSGGLFTRAVAREIGRTLTDEEAEALQRRHGELFRELLPDRRPLPGAIELLAPARGGLVHGIATRAGARDRRVARGARASRPDRSSSSAATSCGPSPSPTSSSPARSGSASRPSDCYVVGDAVWDLLAARRAGMLSVGLLTGGYGEDELAPPARSASIATRPSCSTRSTSSGSPSPPIELRPRGCDAGIRPGQEVHPLVSRAGWTIAIATTIGVVALVGAGGERLDPVDPRRCGHDRDGANRPRRRDRTGRDRRRRSGSGSPVAGRIRLPRRHRAAGRHDAGVLGGLPRSHGRRSAPGLLPPARVRHVRHRRFGTGVRWAVLAARLDGTPSNQVFESWPDGPFKGPCRQVEVSILPGDPVTETLCGRTIGTTDVETWSHRVTWTCVGCLIPDGVTRAITLYEWLAVPAGTVPTWEIFADLGG